MSHKKLREGLLRRLSIVILGCGQFLLMSACGHARSQQSSGSPEVNAEAPAKVVKIDWHAKLATLQKELARNPNSASLHSQAGVAYDALGDFPSFEKETRLAMDLDKENSVYCYSAYAVYKRRHLKEEEVSALERALQIDPGNPFGHYEMATLLEDDKKWTDALTEYETTKKLVDAVKQNSSLNYSRWSYVDPRGGFYDVTFEKAHIDDDIARVRAAMSGSK
jgi:tetratricopeptide (TPR) repeat protein